MNDELIAEAESIPPVLYKYRTFDDNGYGISMAAKGDVFFASSRGFNDPFENYFIPTSKALSLPDNELETYLRKKTRQLFPDVSFYERPALLRRALTRAKKHRENPALISQELQEIQHDKFGILSLAKSCTSLPMWAYYAANHEGMCIGLKTSVIKEHQLFLFRKERKLIAFHDVDYTTEIPIINIDTPLDGELSKQKMEELEVAHYTKSDFWKHEDEIRLILWNYPNYSYSFGKDVVKEIIIGLKTEEDDKKRLIEELKKSGSTATVKVAHKSIAS